MDPQGQPQELTPEQRQELQNYLKELEARDQQQGTGQPGPQNQPQPQQNQQVQTVTLADGSTVSGTPEQIAQQVAQRYNQAVQASQQTQPQGTSDEFAPNFNFQEFEKRFNANVPEAMSYLYKSQYGYDPAEVLPALYQALEQGYQRINQVEGLLTEQRLQEIPGYQNSPENKAVLDQVIQSRGWQPNLQSYQDAVRIAQAEGRLQQPATQGTPNQAQQYQAPAQQGPLFGQPQPQSIVPQAEQHDPTRGFNFPTPVGNSSGAPSTDPMAEFVRQAESGNVPLDDLRTQIQQLEQYQRTNGQA